MKFAAYTEAPSCRPTYVRRQPEKSALYRVILENLLTFEQQWTDEASGRKLPKFVTDELHRFVDCGILSRGMSEGAANLVDHVVNVTGRWRL